MTFNRRFKELRKELKLTQVQLANALNVSQGTITDIERGRIGVSDKVAKALFEKFPQINQGWFYTGDGQIINEINGISILENAVKNTGIDTGSIDINEILSKVIKEVLVKTKLEENRKKDPRISYVSRLFKATKRDFPEYHSFVNDINEIIDVGYLISAIDNSRIGGITTFALDNLLEINNFDQLKELYYKEILELIKFKGIIHESANLAREFRKKIKPVAEELKIDFDFDLSDGED